MKSVIHLFADDTKIHAPINNIQDAIALQEDINDMELWSDIWLLNFHPDKCHVLTVGKHQNIVHAHNYTLNGVELEHVFEEKDLGVIVDSNLKFEEHLTEKAKKANIISGLIQRSFSHLDGKVFKTLFTSFVRPHLEYVSAVWSPHLKKHINQIEKVQRRATKRVNGFKNLPYDERLRRLHIPTLAFRRLKTDMVELFKHLHVYDKDTLLKSFQRLTRPSRKHNFQLLPRVPRDGVRGIQTNSFYFRSIDTWNNLPKSVVDSPSVSSFKRNLEKAWNDHPLKYDIN